MIWPWVLWLLLRSKFANPTKPKQSVLPPLPPPDAECPVCYKKFPAAFCRENRDFTQFPFLFGFAQEKMPWKVIFSKGQKKFIEGLDKGTREELEDMVETVEKEDGLAKLFWFKHPDYGFIHEVYPSYRDAHNAETNSSKTLDEKFKYLAYKTNGSSKTRLICSEPDDGTHRLFVRHISIEGESYQKGRDILTTLRKEEIPHKPRPVYNNDDDFGPEKDDFEYRKNYRIPWKQFGEPQIAYHLYPTRPKE